MNKDVGLHREIETWENDWHWVSLWLCPEDSHNYVTGEKRLKLYLKKPHFWLIKQEETWGNQDHQKVRGNPRKKRTRGQSCCPPRVGQGLKFESHRYNCFFKKYSLKKYRKIQRTQNLTCLKSRTLSTIILYWKS